MKQVKQQVNNENSKSKWNQLQCLNRYQEQADRDLALYVCVYACVRAWNLRVSYFIVYFMQINYILQHFAIIHY